MWKPGPTYHEVKIQVYLLGCERVVRCPFPSGRDDHLDWTGQVQEMAHNHGLLEVYSNTHMCSIKLRIYVHLIIINIYVYVCVCLCVYT